MTAFAELHRPGAPLLLPNAWDHASAAALAAAGFAAVGTTSLGVAAAHGKPDGAAVTRAETLAVARLLVPIGCLVSVDAEQGFSDEPAAVADFMAELADLGVAGVNVEDGRADGRLVPAADHAAVVAAIRARVPDLFVNARTDTFWLGGPDASLDEALERGRAYAAAGADGWFVPGAVDDATIAALTAAIDLPLNILFTPGKHSLPRLAELGVGRVSTGSGLFRIALRAALDAAVAVRDGGTLAGVESETYAEIQARAGTETAH
jgi:2-methylisocitrate lyase-like PEP mutase family enzyme